MSVGSIMNSNTGKIRDDYMPYWIKHGLDEANQRQLAMEKRIESIAALETSLEAANQRLEASEAANAALEKRLEASEAANAALLQRLQTLEKLLL